MEKKTHIASENSLTAICVFRVRKMKEKIKNEFIEFKLLFKSVPSLITSLFVISVFAMNLLANKSISFGVSFLALDCGTIVSWFSFFAMDVITKHFGPKASTQMSIVALLFNLSFCLLFFVCSVIPGVWGESYVEGCQDVINNALDKTFGGSWFVVLGSATAFFVSAVVNNFTNWGIGKLFRKNPDGAGAYMARTYISTAIGQFVDNIIFALIVSKLFFGWTFVQCITSATTTMVVELLLEIVFSRLGFSVCKKWKNQNVGKEYFDFVAQKKNGSATIV